MASLTITCNETDPAPYPRERLPPAVAPAAPQAEAGHQPGDATPAAADAVRDEVGMDAGMAVLDGHAQRIRGHPARVGVCEAPEAVLPCVVPRPRDTHGLAEGGDWPA